MGQLFSARVCFGERSNLRGLSLVGLGGLLALTACASQPVVADLRPAYLAAAETAADDMLDCEGVNDMVCTCRREGMMQEFAEPSRARWDQGYAALAAYKDDPANANHTARYAEDYAVNTILTAIKTDVENICSYHEEEAAH